MTPAEVAEFVLGLTHFHGTENYYRHWLGLNYTDGVKYIADKAGAYWFLDIVASYQRYLSQFPGMNDFQVWQLSVNVEVSSGVVVCEDGNENEMVRQDLPFTDFPLQRISLWVENGTILLPSEH